MNKIIVIALLVASNCASAIDWNHSQEVAQLFADAEVNGTFVLYDVAADKLTGFQ